VANGRFPSRPPQEGEGKMSSHKKRGKSSFQGRKKGTTLTPKEIKQPHLDRGEKKAVRNLRREGERSGEHSCSSKENGLLELKT